MSAPSILFAISPEPNTLLGVPKVVMDSPEDIVDQNRLAVPDLSSFLKHRVLATVLVGDPNLAIASLCWVHIEMVVLKDVLNSQTRACGVRIKPIRVELSLETISLHDLPLSHGLFGQLGVSGLDLGIKRVVLHLVVGFGDALCTLFIDPHIFCRRVIWHPLSEHVLASQPTNADGWSDLDLAKARNVYLRREALKRRIDGPTCCIQKPRASSN